jgi:hypothetical protein
MFNNSFLNTALFFCVSFMLLGCSEQSSKDKSPVIARVGKAVLTVDDLNHCIPPEYKEQISDKQRIDYVKQWIEKELLYQAALRQKLHKEPDIRSKLDQMKKDFLGAEMISRNIARIQAEKIPEEEIINFYEQNKNSFIRQNDVVKYTEIIVDNLNSAWTIRNQITPENFYELASEYSITPVQDPQKVRFIPINALPAEIAATVASLMVNRISLPVKYTDGIHIIYLLDKQKKGGICFLEEVREDVINTIITRAQQAAINTLIADLRQKTDYEFHFELVSQTKKNTGDSLSLQSNKSDYISRLDTNRIKKPKITKPETIGNKADSVRISRRPKITNQKIINPEITNPETETKETITQETVQ